MPIEIIPIGRTNKTHGTDGTMRITIDPAYERDFLAAKVVFLNVSGQATPFFVESRPGNETEFIKLEEVDSREAARSLTNLTLSLRREDIRAAGPSPLPQAALLIGYQIEDHTEGRIGEVADVMELPQQLMAVVNYQDREILIPLTEALILDIDPKRRRILMDLPTGLLGLS